MELIKTSEIESRLESIEKSLFASACSVYLLVLGNQTKKAIETLPDHVSGIELLWSGWFGPKWMKLFSYFAAGYGGVFKFLDRSRLKELALEASLGGLIQIIIVKDPIDLHLKRLISENRLNPQIIQENIAWDGDNTLIEISCDTNETIESEPAGYFSSWGM